MPPKVIPPAPPATPLAMVKLPAPLAFEMIPLKVAALPYWSMVPLLLVMVNVAVVVPSAPTFKVPPSNTLLKLVPADTLLSRLKVPLFATTILGRAGPETGAGAIVPALLAKAEVPNASK